MSRRGYVLFAAVITAGFAVSGPAAAASSNTASVNAAPPPGPGNVAHAAALRAAQAFEARMQARAARPGTASPAPPGAATGGSGFGRIRNVEPIAADAAPSINGAEPDTVTEPDVAIDPVRPGTITAVAQQGRYLDGGSADPGYATSRDGGRTWIHANLPGLTEAVGGTFQRASDAAVAFGPDGSDYAQTIPFDQTDARSGVAVQRSADGGRTFGPPVLVVDDNNVNVFNDKNWIAVDTSRHSPFYGRIYSVWSRFITTGSGATAVTHSPGTVSWSDDHGRTWSPFVFTGPADENTEGLLPLISRDGAVTVVYDQTIGSNDFEVAQTSHDGGRTWTAPVTIGQFLGAEVPGMRTGGLPTAAIDPVTGRMYVAWQDARFNASGLNDIVLSVSSDGGRTWSAPRPASPAGAGLDRFTPAVAAYAGKVYLSYRTRAAQGTAPAVTEDLVVSGDGGRTFGPQRHVGPPAVLKYAAVANSPTTAFLGDYMGLAASGRLAVLAWCVSSVPPVAEPYHQLLWAATVTG